MKVNHVISDAFTSHDTLSSVHGRYAKCRMKFSLGTKCIPAHDSGRSGDVCSCRYAQALDVPTLSVCRLVFSPPCSINERQILLTKICWRAWRWLLAWLILLHLCRSRNGQGIPAKSRLVYDPVCSLYLLATDPAITISSARIRACATY